VQSYRGVLHYGVVSAPHVVDDMDALVAHLLDAHDELAALAAARR